MSNTPSEGTMTEMENDPQGYRAFVGKHTGNWSSIERDPTPQGGQVWDSKRRAWVDARTGEVVGKVAA